GEEVLVRVVGSGEGQTPLSRGTPPAGGGKAVLTPAPSGRHEPQLATNRLQPLDIGLGGLDRGVSLVTLGVSRDVCSLGCLEFVATLVHHLLRYVPMLDEHFSTVIIRSGKIQVALALGDERNG